MNAPTDAAAELVTLADCPIGLFRHGYELCLKTEYGSNEGRIDAYIVSTGEFFWGPKPQGIASQRACMVTPVDTAWNTRPPTDAAAVREAAARVRPFAEWHEDHGQVLWWRLPISEAPYVGSPLDLGRGMKVIVQIGVEEHELPMTNTGGWPFDEEDEGVLWWTPLPNANEVTAAVERLLTPARVERSGEGGGA